MTTVFVLALVLTSVGYLEHWLGLTVIGGGAVCVLWWGAAGDYAWSALAAYLRLRWQRRQLESALCIDEREIDQARRICRAFLVRYPHHVRLPFELTEKGHVRLTHLHKGGVCSFERSALPAPYLDMQTVLVKKGIHVSQPLLPVLWMNQEVKQAVRRRLHAEVLQGLALDRDDEWTRLWLRYAVWERERQVQDGGKTMLYREELASYIVDLMSEKVDRTLPRKSDRALTHWIDRGIEQAHEQILRRQRAYKLEALLEPVKTAPVHDPLPSLTMPAAEWSAAASHLAERFAHEPAQVTNWLCKVFTGSEPATSERADALTLGYFLAKSGQEQVVFQVGWLEQGAVPLRAVERAYAARGRENAQRAVLLSLGPVASHVCQDADELGVLVLPADALDRLLAYHADRMWQAVEWSLRTSSASSVSTQDANVSENIATPLELGLST